MELLRTIVLVSSGFTCQHCANSGRKLEQNRRQLLGSTERGSRRPTWILSAA